MTTKIPQFQQPRRYSIKKAFTKQRRVKREKEGSSFLGSIRKPQGKERENEWVGEGVALFPSEFCVSPPLYFFNTNTIQYNTINMKQNMRRRISQVKAPLLCFSLVDQKSRPFFPLSPFPPFPPSPFSSPPVYANHPTYQEAIPTS